MPAVPTLPTFSPGIVTSTDLGLLASNGRFLANPPRAELRQTVTQPIATGTPTAVTFDAFDVDTDVDGVGGHSTAVNNTRFTARYPGWYSISGAVGWPVGATNRRDAWFRINGVDQNASEASGPASAAGNTTTASRRKLVYLSIGDYVELIAFQDSGGSLSTQVTTTAQSSMTILWKSN